MRLFTERGYDATTIAEIASIAELAPRTVTGYFPSKIDMATAVTDDLASSLAAAYTAAPDDDGITVIRRWLDTDVANSDFELIRLSAAMTAANPNLAALTSSNVAAAAAVGSARMARDLSVSPDHPTVAICNAALGNAIGTYIGLLASCDLDDDLRRWFLNFVTAIFDAARLSSG
jgi:AcrR family transcriptional regulator